MKTSSNNNNIESNNGMSQVIIDMRPQVKHQDGHGREVLADVHFRIDVRAYTANLYTYTKEAREESEKACEAYYSEVVELLKAEGWTLRKERYGVGDCPQMVKGTQYLYCHPQDISGQVTPADIETLEAKIKALTSCKFYKTDNYGDIIVTTSESDEKQLYRDIYPEGIGDIVKEVISTKRCNLYKDVFESVSCIRQRICIPNRRADLNVIGTGSYNMRTPLVEFLNEEYDRLKVEGWIKETQGKWGPLCRWINKKEEKERAKAIREAEKAEKERETATLEPASEITEFFTKGKKYRCINSVIGNKSGRETFTKGKVYEQYTEPSVFYGWLRNNQGERHAWPQIDEIADYLETWPDTKPEDIDPRLYFEPVEDITEAEDIREAEGIKVGDRVWCKHGEVMGTVTAIRIWNPDYAFKVRLDKPVTLFGRTFEETEFRRAGITKNYDRDGMIVGNAQYYAEQLKYGPASIIEYELAGVALRTESTREDVEPDSREGWGNEFRVTIHHQTGDTTETMTLSETAELLARMYQEEQGKAA